MTLHVKHGKFRLALWCPNSFSGLVVKSVLKHNKHTKDVRVDKKVIKQIVKSLRQAKKIHGKLELVSVNAAEGTRVKINL